ncbi:small basic domain protein [Parvimonas sp. KA00067]|uniref:hypothetical protein n=1 Tax=Parvimonas sp. KA00067 TaxID=1588755 RepID=UPI00079C107F|nr:hypothetical protein [Parvimonas sp. KA00067]KXB67664.1 small basic domain protein [Parvimonas sp. KA00067]
MIILFFNIIFLICITILGIHQGFYLYEFNKILKNLKVLGENKDLKENKKNILEYNYNLAQLNYIFCVCFSTPMKKYFEKKIKFEYIE